MNMIAENSARNHYGLYAVGQVAPSASKTRIKQQSYGVRRWPAPAAAVADTEQKYAWPSASTL